MYVKHKVIENSMISDTLVVRGADNAKAGGAAYVDLDNDYMSDFVEGYEDSMRKKKEKAAEASRIQEPPDNSEGEPI
jgi:hypothetical protein